jgi:hypothetical protein
MSGKIFISYRRHDARWEAKKIYDAFCAVLSKDGVFMDVDSIPLGVDFKKTLRERLDQCDIFLALIGPNWLTITDPKTGRRRIDDEKDFVRMEISEALKRGIPVVPVLLDGTPMPKEGELPEALRDLTQRQAEFLYFKIFDAGVVHLVKNLGMRHQTLIEPANSSSAFNSYAKVAGLGALLGSLLQPFNQAMILHLGPLDIRLHYATYAAAFSLFVAKLISRPGLARPIGLFIALCAIDYIFRGFFAESVLEGAGRRLGDNIPGEPFIIIIEVVFPAASLLLEWLAVVKIFSSESIAQKDTEMLLLVIATGAVQGLWATVLIFMHVGPGLPFVMPFWAFQFATTAILLLYASRRSKPLVMYEG